MRINENSLHYMPMIGAVNSQRASETLIRSVDKLDSRTALNKILEDMNGYLAHNGHHILNDDITRERWRDTQDLISEFTDNNSVIDDSDVRLVCGSEQEPLGVLVIEKNRMIIHMPCITAFVTHIGTHLVGAHLLEAAFRECSPITEIAVELTEARGCISTLRNFGFKNKKVTACIDYMVLNLHDSDRWIQSNDGWRLLDPLNHALLTDQPMGFRISQKEKSPTDVISTIECNDTQTVKHSTKNMIISYLEEVKRFLHNETQPGQAMYEHDKKLLPLYIAAENNRNSDLNLSYDDSVNEYVKSIGRLNKNERYLSIIREEAHYVVAEAFKNDKNNTSIILLESLGNKYMTLLDFSSRVSNALPNSRITFINLGVQKSPYDCIIYSLSAALKINKNKAIIASLHNAVLKQGSITGWSGKEYPLNKTEISISPSEAGDILPAQFFKHMSSETSMKKLLDTNPALAFTNVSDKKSENLPARQSRLLATQTTTFAEMATYSISIEKKRKAIIERLLKAGYLYDETNLQRTDKHIADLPA